MKQADIVVVGGSAAGLTAAITARRHYPGKSILLVRQEKQVPIPCGIPYVFGTVGTPDKNLIPDTPLEKNNVELLLAEATDIDREAKVLKTDADHVQYDRLILATGSRPVVPPIPGCDKDGVYTVLKDVNELARLQNQVKTAQDIVIVGGGFIGIEFADEIKKSGDKNVTVVEVLDHCLGLAYDPEFCEEMGKIVESRGVKLMTSTKVESIEGAEAVQSVKISGDQALKADLVLLSIGAAANVDLAKKTGLRIGLTGGIAVDRTMKSSDENIFACGDCAEKISFFGGGVSPLKLASIATHEARIAGANLFGIRRENCGTVGVWATAVGDFAIGTAGLTETLASRKGYRTVTASIEGPNRHPGCMPGASNVKVKLVFEAHSGVLLGGQVSGSPVIGELTNAVSACVQRRMTAEEIAMFQIGTHPALTASPIAYALVNAAEMAIGQMKKDQLNPNA